MISMEWLICLCLVLATVQAQTTDSNPCTPQVNCEDCIRAGKDCSWCAEPNFNVRNGRTVARCNYRSDLEMKYGCPDNFLSKEKSFSQNTTDTPFGSVVQVKPQVISVALRPYDPAQFTISIKPAENYPVDLYYLMDMSYSMRDDLANLVELGIKIAEEIGKITSNYRLGFGSFVDKAVSPYIQIEKKDNPCDGCAPTFGYIHNMKFVKDSNAFREAVRAQKISGNLDSPEGGFDALLQATVCTSELGWQDVDKARRIILFVTDAYPHIAGDGKIGGIVTPNDGRCYLQTVGGVTSYAKSTEMDYPSIFFLKQKMKENRIVPIIATTGDVKDVYDDIIKEWADLGAQSGVLKADSSNIVELVRDTYSKISTTVKMTHNAPADISVTFKARSNCRDGAGTAVCNNVAINQQVDFDVTVTAKECSEELRKLKGFKISIPGFGDIQVNTTMICDCDCKKSGVPNSPACNGTGTAACGICYCNPGRFGDQCQCDNQTAADLSLCRSNGSSADEPVCSGFGTCICGKCECTKRKDPSEIISGTYCQCNNFGCERHEGRICGGPKQGRCECGKCKCEADYTGTNCGGLNCTLVARNCERDGKVCSGNGDCDCGKCVCKTGYKGVYCENCVSCPGKCDLNRDCVLCQAFNEGPKKETCKEECHLDISLVNKTEEKCAVLVGDNCYVVFSFLPDPNGSGNETVLVQRDKRCVVVIKKEPNILAIILGTIGGIVLLGLLLLLLWKLLITAYDNYEYHKFEKDRMKSKWEKEENPIYRPSKQQFKNPAYAGAQ